MKRQFQIGYVENDLIEEFRKIKNRLNGVNFGNITSEKTMEFLIKSGNEKLDNGEEGELF